MPRRLHNCGGLLKARQFPFVHSLKTGELYSSEVAGYVCDKCGEHVMTPATFRSLARGVAGIRLRSTGASTATGVASSSAGLRLKKEWVRAATTAHTKVA